MNSIISKLLIQVLYFTPVGYLLRLATLYTGEATPGVYVHLPRSEAAKVFVKKNPLFVDRMHWLLTGVFLVLQACVIVFYNLGGELGAAYAWMAVVFGMVNVVSAFFPKLNWSGGSRPFRISSLWVLIIVSLVVVTVAPDIGSLINHFGK